MSSFGKLRMGRSTDSSKTSQATVHESKEAFMNGQQVKTEPGIFSAFEVHNTETPQSDHKLVHWGVGWHKVPLLIILLFTIGTAGAIAHHCFYLSYEGKEPVDDVQKQTAVLIGNILSFFAIFMWRLACSVSYKQYIWTTVKRKSLKLSTLDKIFSLTSDPRGFFSWEVLTKTKVLVVMAFIAWTMPVGGIGLSSTLIVVSQPFDYPPEQITVWGFDWKDGSWFPSRAYPVIPTSNVLKIATQVATNMNVIRFRSFGYNSSYTFELPGPYVRCEPANSTQQAILAGYEHGLAWANIATAANFNEIKTLKNFNFAPTENVWSAFDPSLGGPFGWVRTYNERFNGDGFEPDNFNNWGVNVPFNASGYFAEGLDQTNLTKEWDSLGQNRTGYPVRLRRLSQMVPRQLWVVASNTSLVCTLGKATREVTIRSVNNIQHMSYGELQNFNPLFVPRYGNIPNSALQPTTEDYAYVAVWQSLLNMLSGNVSTAHDVGEDARIHASESNVLLTSLTSCKEFTQNYWIDHWYTGYRNVTIGKDGKPSGNSSIPANTNLDTSAFSDVNPWLCRNGTLARAIEDLAVNLTLSLLTSDALVSEAADPLKMPLFVTTNVQRFRYDKRTVLISYIITGLFAFMCVLLGLYAFIKNGITQNNSFSGMVSVTRNAELDRDFTGYSTGAKPIAKDLQKKKFRMGVVSVEGENGEGVGHVAFAGEDRVVGIVKGGAYR